MDVSSSRFFTVEEQAVVAELWLDSRPPSDLLPAAANDRKDGLSAVQAGAVAASRPDKRPSPFHVPAMFYKTHCGLQWDENGGALGSSLGCAAAAAAACMHCALQPGSRY